ncbi:MAG: hypothetical protein LiPW39_558 [Parcubacteria group bacterium LiPW_39]|nr:MAG: hypothetical protein LiPW39_558 [Parcubacteria group bacterium LiPW_39]
MISKTKEKSSAIALRKKGLSYNEILKLVPVSKSTLSLWLRDVGLAKKQKQRLSEKRRLAQIKAQQACRAKRVKITEEIKSIAKGEVGLLNERELWLIGAALYWAEGSKQKANNVSARVAFSNSDPQMLKLFLEWLRRCCKILPQDIIFSIYLHETATERKSEIQRYWAETTGFPLNQFNKIVWKKNKINTRRKNIGENYYGLLRITVHKSTNLNRKIAGWIEGISKNHL